MTQKNIVIFDLDGTLANTAECRHHLEGTNKDWDSFYRDACKVSPMEAVVQMCLTFQRSGYMIYIVSGRSDVVRNETEIWLSEQGILPAALIMRKHGDHTPDDQLKKSWIDSGMINKEKILCVFEDRNRMVKMWREIGIPCFQVAEGDF